MNLTTVGGEPKETGRSMLQTSLTFVAVIGIGVGLWLSWTAKRSIDAVSESLSRMKDSVNYAERNSADLTATANQLVERVKQLDESRQRDSAEAATLTAALRQEVQATLERIGALESAHRQGLDASVEALAQLSASSERELEKLAALEAARTQDRDTVSSQINAVNSIASQALNRLDAIETTRLAEADALQTRLANLNNSVSQALGKIVVEEAPDALRAAVDQALKRWLPNVAWSSAPGNSDDLRAEIASILDATPPSVSSELAGPMRRLQWWADVLELTELSADSVGRLPSLLARSRDLEATAPFRAPPWTIERLAAFRKQALFAGAKIAVKDALAAAMPGTTSITAGEARALLEAAQELHRPGSPEHAELQRLTSDLAKKYPDEENPSIQTRLQEIDRQRKRLAKITDIESRQHLGSAIEAQATTLLLEADEGDINRIQSLALAIRSGNRSDLKRFRDQEWLKYQAWALGQIQKAEPLITKAITKFGDDERAICSALSSHLMEVDEGLLEPAIARKFNEVWQLGWSQLEWDVDDKGSEWWTDRKRLLEILASTPKKQIGEVR